MVGMWHLAAISSASCAVASTNSTCLAAAGDFASGRTTSDLADSRERILDQLPSRDRHGAVRIDFYDDVIQGQAGDLRCAALPVSRVRSSLCRVCLRPGAGIFLAPRFLAAGAAVSSSIFVRRLAVARHLPAAVIGRDQGGEYVRGGEGNLGQGRMGSRAFEGRARLRTGARVRSVRASPQAAESPFRV